jgi:hypothetical protein
VTEQRRGASLGISPERGIYCAARRDHNVVITILRREDKMTAVELDSLGIVTEIDGVRSWRFEELLRAGYDDDDAMELAFHTEVDLHWATGLVRRGCPSSLAVQIAL